MSLSIDLSGRVVMVTGASSGLGAHFAKTAAAAGAKVVVAARRVDRLEALAKDLQDGGAEAIAVPMDVADENSIIAAYDEAETSLGPVDSVIANAGMNISGLATNTAAEEFDQVMNVNLRGVFLTAREAAKRMIDAGSQEREHGRIVLIGSIMSTSVGPGLAAYCASKAGLEQLGRVLAAEWVRQGISVNTVRPGYILTELGDGFLESEAGQEFIKAFPRQRLMEASDLDHIVFHLLSDAGRRTTGAVFTLDDGQTLV
ncbi:MAG: SDR family NAD(P)-dependent oxidoreductase [Pseudomonadota bacterium]